VPRCPRVLTLFEALRTRGRSEVKFPDQLDQWCPACGCVPTTRVFKCAQIKSPQKVAQDIDVPEPTVARLTASLKLLDR